MTVNKKYFVKKELKNSEEAIFLAKKIIAGKTESDIISREACKKLINNAGLDTECKHYVYLVGETVSDLIIIEYAKQNGTYAFRKCTQEEWLEYYQKFVL
jgi:hypothetical protein